MKRKIKQFIVKSLIGFSYIVPKKKKLWIFGAWSGKLYADNAKSMFEYINEKKQNVKAVWLTGEDDIAETVKGLGYRCYKSYSLMGIWITMRAEVAFETEGEYDLSEFLNINRTKVIQLWHGMGAKAMKWKMENGELTIEEKKTQMRFSSYYWISTSELYTNTLSGLLGVPKERFVITGYPRNDNLLRAPYNGNMEFLKETYKDCKFIIYMPTHRNFGMEGNKIINLDEFKKVDMQLKENDMVMVYKPHIHELKNLLPYENIFSNIILAKEQEIWGDVYSYLHYFDLLISDYSSVLTDFMCTGKPVVLFPYDIDDYIKGDAGLNDYFWEIPGGPMCYTWDEVVEKSHALLIEDDWKEERERCRVQYHYYNDGRNCERVCNMVENILKNKM